MVARKSGAFKGRAKKRSNKRSPGARRAAAPSTALTKAVSTIVARKSETKYAAEMILDAWSSPQIPSSYVNFNSDIQYLTDWYRCLPLVTVGDNSNERIGSKISPTSIKVHLNFKFDPSATGGDQNARDITVVVYCGHPKSVGAYSATTANSVWPAGTPANNYLDDGNNTETFFHGTWTDSIKKIASDNFTLKAKRMIRLYKPAGTQNTTVGISSVTSAPECLNKSTTIVFKNPSTLKYMNSSASLPSNFAHCFAVGYYYNDGEHPDAGGGLLKVSARLEMFYKDD